MASGSWRWLGPERLSAEAALARGAELLTSAEPGGPVTVAWWVVEEPVLVLGRGSRIAADEPACRAAGVRIARRGSGGGPVLWDRDLLALDVVIPRDHQLHSDDVVDSYRPVGRLAEDALRRLGLDVHALTPDEARTANDRALAELACFAGRSPWEVVLGERKIVGLSQVRRRTGVLVQVGVSLTSAARTADLLAIDPVSRALLADALAAAIGDDARPSHERIVEALRALTA